MAPRCCLCRSLLLIALTMASACTPPRATSLTASIAAAKIGDRICIRDIPEDQWTAVALFGPYNDQTTVDGVLGFHWSGYKRTDLRNDDSFSLLVFVKAGRVVRDYSVGRCQPDFDLSIQKRLIPQSAACFTLADMRGCRVLGG